jgi:sulfur-oxidizing protein SoxX
MKNMRRLLLASAVVCLSACDTGPKGSAGFTLPDGDVERGKAQYIALRCNACHENKYVPQLAADEPAPISVVLGGKSARIRTYGELVTSIINPSHRIAHSSSQVLADESGSRMINYNSMMTVSELIDLVAFVQSSYELTPQRNTVYPVYWHPEKPGEKK